MMSGLSDDQIREASEISGIVAGDSTYFHSILYSVENFREELDRMVEHMKTQARKAA